MKKFGKEEPKMKELNAKLKKFEDEEITFN